MSPKKRQRHSEVGGNTHGSKRVRVFPGRTNFLIGGGQDPRSSLKESSIHVQTGRGKTCLVLRPLAGALSRHFPTALHLNRQHQDFGEEQALGLAECKPMRPQNGLRRRPSRSIVHSLLRFVCEFHKRENHGMIYVSRPQKMRCVHVTISE